MKPLQGETAWLITDGKAGHEAQAQGVAEALGVAYQWRRVTLTGLARMLAPWGPAPADAAWHCTPPWPDLAIGVGRTVMPALRRLRRLAGPATFVVALQDPRTSASIADLIWVPEHDRRRGPNVITTLTAPHRFTPALLDGLRAAPDARIDALPGPRVMVAVGGNAKAWRFTDEDAANLAAAIATFGRAGASFMVTTSRRTPPAVAAALLRALQPYAHVLFTGEGENPYARFLAKADAIIVTADSVSMTAEAVATGRPVYVFRPSGGSNKFGRFHDSLYACGATRPLNSECQPAFDWGYAPILAAQVIAQEIAERFANRRRFIARSLTSQ
ncbi:MAG TPA: mitochondrial fission ELM1 family protein [Hyphomicrobiaceae bacterium]|nr:mitochondrial fission ELM1 family protein [Hyphomicrobiaceae bacterium]